MGFLVVGARQQRSWGCWGWGQGVVWQTRPNARGNGANAGTSSRTCSNRAAQWLVSAVKHPLAEGQHGSKGGRSSSCPCTSRTQRQGGRCAKFGRSQQQWRWQQWQQH